MKVFISYFRHDEPAVRAMVRDLERASVQVWLDEDLGGGDAWWTEILKQIRSCTVFLFALSDNSLFSKPCRAELAYAQALGLPIVPVQIGDVSSFRADPIFSRQLIDYREPSSATGFALIGGLHECAAHRGELPDPLPDPPPIPYEYLQRLGAVIREPGGELSFSAQTETLFELRNALNEEDDPSVQEDIRSLLSALRRRKEVSQAIATEIDALLGSKRARRRSRAKPVVAQPQTVPEVQTPDRPSFWRRSIDAMWRSGTAVFALALALAAAAVAVALTGSGGPPHGGDLPRGVVTVTGVDPSNQVT